MNQKAKAIAAVVLIIVFSILVAIYRDDLSQFSNYGYLGVFVGCFLSNSTVFLPAPSSAIVFTAGGIYNPLSVTILGALGASTGEIIGYIAGLTGRAAINPQNKNQVKVRKFLETYGMGAIFLFAFMPLPLFDLVGVAAGVSKMNFSKFFLPCLIGKLFKMAIYAYAGAGILPTFFPVIDKIIKINN